MYLVSDTSFSLPPVNYLALEEVSRSYGERVLFTGLSFGLEKGQKMALVARNGSGKTSLMRIIMGIEPPEAGNVVFRNDIRIGYLEQEPMIDPKLKVIEAVLNPADPMMEAVAAYELALEHPDDHAALQTAFERVDALGAWDTEQRVTEILHKLDIHDTEQVIGTLSGGQRRRVALARILIDSPDILLLDEPTNHLDIDMIEWLEGYLSRPERTLLMVTHDRVFLDSVCDTILELEDGQLYRHRGNYSTYLENKAHREEVAGANLERAKNLYARELEWMRRQPKARTTKSKSRVDAFVDVEANARKKVGGDSVQIEINMERLGAKVVELHRISKAYGSKILIDKFDYKFKHGERVGIVGANGSGKSTLLNIAMGRMEPDSGKVVLGETVKFGYFGQEGLKAADDKKVIEVIQDIAEFIPLKKGKTMTAAQLLERFLFPRSMHYNYVYKLSGGERKRLYLLTVLMANPNFLILDEPTNDLDILTLNVLEEFLEDFPGCLLIVTHDRHFLNKLSDHLFIFEGNGKIRDINGNYNDYLRIVREEKEATKEVKVPPTPTDRPTQPDAKKRMGFKEKREFEQLEKDMAWLESRKKELTDLMNSGEPDHTRILAWAAEMERLISDLDRCTDRWLELSELSE